MDNFKLKLLESLLYSGAPLEYSKLEELCGLMYTVNKRWRYYSYRLHSTSGRGARIAKVLIIKLGALTALEHLNSPNITTFIKLVSTKKGEIELRWNTSSPYSKPPTWDKDNG